MLYQYKIFFIFSFILATDGRNLSINTENALIGDLRGQIISTTYLLEDVTYRIRNNPALWDILIAPLRAMLNNLTPRVVNSMIEDLLKVTGECADSQVTLHMPEDLEGLVRPQAEVYRSIYDAGETYIDNYEVRAPYNLSSRRPYITDESVYRGIQVSYDYISASMKDFQRGGNRQMKMFIDNFDTLSDLPKYTYHILFNNIMGNSYTMLNLCKAAGDSMTRIADRTKSVRLKQALGATLDLMGKHFKTVAAYAGRSTDRYRAGERELAAKVTDWTKQVATASADDAKVLNAKIDKAKDKMEKYIATRDYVDKYRGYAAAASYIRRGYGRTEKARIFS